MSVVTVHIYCSRRQDFSSAHYSCDSIYFTLLSDRTETVPCQREISFFGKCVSFLGMWCFKCNREFFSILVVLYCI
jgi:hypothetical protein